MISIKKIYKNVFITILIINLFVIRIEAKTYYIGLAGNDNNIGTENAPWASLSYALGSLSPVVAGDEIIVKAGTYIVNDRINFTKSGTEAAPILIKSNGEVIIHSKQNITKSWLEGVFHLNKVKHLIIDGFRIENAPKFGITMIGCNTIVVQNCYVYHPRYSGIISYNFEFGSHPHDPVIGAWNIKIFNCTVEGANYSFYDSPPEMGPHESISIGGTDGFEIAHCTLIDCHKEGIDIKGGSINGSVHHCEIVNQAHGWSGTGMAIYVDAWRYDTKNILIYNNRIYECEEGIRLACENCRINEGEVHNVKIFNNLIYDNNPAKDWYGTGIHINACCDKGQPNPLHPIYDIEISQNTIYGNRHKGIHIKNPDSYNIKIQDNIVYGNGLNKANGGDIVIEDTKGATVRNNLIGQPVKQITCETCDTVGNFVSNPKFVNPGSKDFRLDSNSLAIDLALDTILKFDFNDSIRPIRNRSDIGAFESYFPSSGAPADTTTLNNNRTSYSSCFYSQPFLFPNPSNQTTILKYHIPQSMFVTLELLSSSGEIIEIIFRDYQQTGLQQVDIDTSGLKEGVYFLCVKTAEFLDTVKLLVKN